MLGHGAASRAQHSTAVRVPLGPGRLTHLPYVRTGIYSVFFQSFNEVGQSLRALGKLVVGMIPSSGAGGGDQGWVGGLRGGGIVGLAADDFWLVDLVEC